MEAEFNKGDIGTIRFGDQLDSVCTCIKGRKNVSLHAKIHCARYYIDQCTASRAP